MIVIKRSLLRHPINKLSAMSKIHKKYTTTRPCTHRKDKREGASDFLPEPQLPEESRPKRWKNVVYVNHDYIDENGIFISGFKCLLCNFPGKTSGLVQQHCKKHYPPTYHCTDCGDSFHLKTEYTQHFDDYFSKEKRTCEYCGSSVQERGLSAHYKSTKCIKARKAKGIFTEYETESKKTRLIRNIGNRIKERLIIRRRKKKIIPCEMECKALSNS